VPLRTLLERTRIKNGARRLVAPGHRGYDWVKWVAELEVSGDPGWLEPPLPLR
jgi:DMSO/TMAO reductase YedYZ molybdopterin-dependent catalytic subunit